MKELFIALLLLIICLFTIDKLRFQSTKTEYIEKVRIDTLIKTIESKPIIIKTKPTIIYKSDTIIKTKSFIAKIDTVILRDTVQAMYEFPENMFSVSVIRMKDTIYIPQATIFKYRSYDWLRTAGYVAGAFTFGYLSGNSRK